MTKSCRVAVGLIVVAGFFLVACNNGVSGDPSPTGSSTSANAGADASLNKLDPCTLLTTQELQQYQVRTKGEPLNSSDEQGCGFLGSPDSLSRGINLTKSKDSVADYVSRKDGYVKFATNTVNGRDAAQVQISKSNTECSQIIAVGSGTVSVAVTSDKSGDPCGDALQIAKVVEPRLSK
ncbi:DUF3558 domain-containing protein [Kutzneria chonburiensis]|uniref:DUF3558 domain-containing protein n=1 Tax=Kutzneria chonburiensis TaxID=1483604 RepID=A0ABV6MV83_9PSEU|nr:DUF3558 domain-containing protein [Kutzneria chonburiensis]